MEYIGGRYDCVLRDIPVVLNLLKYNIILYICNTVINNSIFYEMY